MKEIDRFLEDAKAEGVDSLTALTALTVAQRALTSWPICHKCNAPLIRYEEALDTGKTGWACERCKWAKDDEAV